MRPKNPLLPSKFLDEVENPSFLSKENGKPSSLSQPFEKSGMPKRWLSLLAPLLEDGCVRRMDMLQSAKLDPAKVSRGYYSDYFSAFQKADILKYDEPNRVWVRGKNFQPYMAFVFIKAMKVEMLRGRWQRIMRLGLENSTAAEYILNLEEEVQEENVER